MKQRELPLLCVLFLATHSLAGELRITSISRAANCTTLTWDSEPGQLYNVEWTDVLANPSSWRQAAINLPSGGAITTWSECTAENLMAMAAMRSASSVSARPALSAEELEKRRSEALSGDELLEWVMKALEEAAERDLARRLGLDTLEAGGAASLLSSESSGSTDAKFYRIVRSAGENRIQSENAKPGTTEWQLANPINVGDQHGWPLSDSDVFPQVQGFASATSVNLSESLTFYVDIRPPHPQFTIEIYRMGWYGGLGARKMNWTDNGQSVQSVTLTSVKQPFVAMNPNDGLIDCLAPWNPATGQHDPALGWSPSYSFQIPADWVSGVYLAKLTSRPSPSVTGKQSYIIFTVREDARSSDFLFQSSVTTYQAYNPWGGNSLYPYPRCRQCANNTDVPNCTPASKVSFNRPYAAATCSEGANYLGYGSGAGEFLTMINVVALPGWEYNMVRWLERQGYDVTYSTSVDTHRPWPAGKVIKTFLSVGHDEYWSPEMRSNVEAARDSGINLGFFAANVCWGAITFAPGERIFGFLGLWRGDFRTNNSPESPAEIALVGVEYVSNPAAGSDPPMKMPDASRMQIDHWVYKDTGLVPEESLPWLLGYEVDGCWDYVIPCNSFKAACPVIGTIRLADSPFAYCFKDETQLVTGHSYMTIYTALPSGAQVFATGTMQWNWGLDDFEEAHFFQQKGDTNIRVSVKAQQLTHNVLRKFSGQETAPIVFTNLDATTSGNWNGVYGSQGHLIANSPSPFSSLGNIQVTIQGQHLQVFTDPSSDSRALLKPNSSERIASAWTTTNAESSNFTIDVNFADSAIHQVSLYCVDWLGSGSLLEKIEVFDDADSTFSHPLDTRNFTLPPNGVYLIWNLSGHKVLRVTKPDATTGNKAMVSALFFDTAPQ